MMRKILLNIHPFLLMLASLLFIYFQAIWESAPIEIIRPFLVLSFVLLLFYPFAIKFAGSWGWGGILMSIVVLGLFFQPTYFLITSVPAALVIFLWFLYRRLTKQHFLVSQISLSLTFVSFFIVAVLVIKLFSVFSPIPFSYYEAMAARSSSNVIPLDAGNLTSKPDIYYLILDAYPRSDILQEIYHYDNSEFIAYLEGLGFIVPENARSNYPRTALSVSSTLDMQYWDTISPDMKDVIFWWPTKPVMQHSRVRESLESIGYKSVSFASDWDLTDNPTADVYLKPYPIRLTGYENYIAVTTPLKPLLSPLQDIAPVMSNEVHRRYILNILENLKNIPYIEGPKFVFAHVILPHPPFVFTADGSPIDSGEDFTFAPRGLSMEEERLGYIAQIEYLNAQLHSVIDTILRESKTPPIIILQADHGSALYYSFLSPETACLKERFSIFGAYYLPGKPRDTIPSNLTPVNLFRIIFNEYFEAQMSLLENFHYFTQGHNLFAGLRDVTESVDRSCNFMKE